ncbi:MAG TPA: class I SAM-dependent methyltransferase [bacterium]|nr:class I SAM-dependent methyltransferase [bacterium]
MVSDQLRRHFDRHADDFDRLYYEGRQTAIQRWLNRRFRSDIVGRYRAALAHVASTQARSVLDVGCGPGHYLSALATMGVPRLVGIDLSERMLELARHNLAGEGITGVELVQRDFLEWETTEQFDVVLALGYFDYFDHPVEHLSRMRALARHSVFASFPSRHWFRTPFRWTRQRIHGTRVYFYDTSRIEALGREAGFPRCTVSKLPGAGMNFVTLFEVGPSHGRTD